ncbi:MAG: CoA-binding protein [Actinobacteria bacterium]|nr:CoA-binding protein [Actinomycetota bacterium]
MSDLYSLANEPDTSYAIVGATDRPGKYGGIIYRDLKGKGFKVFAVNPYRDTVDGDPTWPSVSELPEKPTMVVLVVPAKRGLEVLKHAAEAGIERIWVQPGASSPELVDALEAGGFDYVVEQCVMVRTRAVSA